MYMDLPIVWSTMLKSTTVHKQLSCSVVMGINASTDVICFFALENFVRSVKF